MKTLHLCCALGALMLVPWLCIAQDRPARVGDGANEVLAVVDGTPITYQQIVGDRNLQSEINTMRIANRSLAELTDAQLEYEIVFQSLNAYIVQQLLDGEADKLQITVTEAIMRQVIARERKSSGIADGDDQAWARFVRAQYGLTPSEYRERRRRDLRRNEALNYLAGLRGPIPAQMPVTIYFHLGVTPRDVRREFEKRRGDLTEARNIRFEQFKLYYPQDTTIESRQKLYFAVQNLHERVRNNESLDYAVGDLARFLEEARITGARYEVLPMRLAKDDTELDSITYRLVVSVPRTGGVSELASELFEAEDGEQQEYITFVRVQSREEGKARVFEDPKVQESIRNELFQRRYQENRQKVEQALLKTASVIPERQFRR